MTYVPRDLFGSAAWYYARYRSGYPRDRLDALAARCGLDGTRWVMDVGCGTGQIAIPLASHARHVLAIDPVPEMLALGRQAAQAAGTGNITWLEGDSSRLAALAPPGAHLAVFAASFHWTEQPAVLSALDALLAPGGLVVIINNDLADDEDPDWVRAISEVRARYLGGHRRAGRGQYLDPQESHRDVLARSPFSSVERLTWTWSRKLTASEVAGLQLSYSFSTPDQLADRADAFSGEVRAAIRELSPSGIVTEPFRVEVLIAARP